MNKDIFTKITTPIYSKNIDIISFWDIIDSLEWKNSSEKIVNINEIKHKINKLTPIKREEFIDEVNHKIFRIKKILRSTEIFNNDLFQEDEKKIDSFASHIVAMGKIFYEKIYENPSFAYSLIGDNLIESEFQDFIGIINHLDLPN